MICIENLCFSYSNDGNDLFHDLNLHLGTAPRTCIIGPDGAGKSTLGKLIKGVIKPQSGCVAYHLDGDPKTNPIGYVTADPDDNLVGITVEDDIIFGLENLGLSASDVLERLAMAVEWTGLAGMEKRLVHSLSGGERQKLALAAVVAMGARVVVCDEATTMLDPQARITLKQCLNSLMRRRGTTIIEMTTILSETLDADRVLLLDHGKVLFDGTPTMFLKSAQGQKWLSSSPGILGLMREMQVMGICEATHVPNIVHVRSFIGQLLQS